MIYYRLDSQSKWHVLPSEVQDIRAWAEKKLEDFAYQDSDGDYRAQIEFYHPDRTRTYAVGCYQGYYNENGGSMYEWQYGTYYEMQDYFGEYAVKEYEFGPGRDWIFL